jgi:tripartite-type tricarboxylate transporter receptor subunit TctC
MIPSLYAPSNGDIDEHKVSFRMAIHATFEEDVRMITRRNVLQAASGLTALAATGGWNFAHAQNINVARVLYGFPPAGSSDALLRTVNEGLRGRYATSLIVEHRPGAGGQLAVVALKDSVPDGSTLMQSFSSVMTVYPLTYPKLPYTINDVAPVCTAAFFNHGLAVGAAVPAHITTIKDFLVWVKEDPSRATIGNPAGGSMPHLLAALLGKLTNIDFLHAPYRGSAPGLFDLIGGQIPAFFAPMSAMMNFQKSGRLRILAISGKERSAVLPEVPTFLESGIEVTSREWSGYFLPGKAAPEVIRHASEHLQAVISQPKLAEIMLQYGSEVNALPASAVNELMHSDAEEWRRVVKEVGFTHQS